MLHLLTFLQMPEGTPEEFDFSLMKGKVEDELRHVYEVGAGEEFPTVMKGLAMSANKLGKEIMVTFNSENYIIKPKNQPVTEGTPEESDRPFLRGDFPEKLMKVYKVGAGDEWSTVEVGLIIMAERAQEKYIVTFNNETYVIHPNGTVEALISNYENQSLTEPAQKAMEVIERSLAREDWPDKPSGGE